MNKKFMIGCCYYPEHWDENNIEYDILKIKKLGFNTIRMGEFSWSMYEKEEGQYDFSVLLKAVNAAKKENIDVILGTPTAAPPKWLSDKYPEILCVNENGKQLHHGSRQHHNHTSEIYLKYCAAITEKMVKTFQNFDNVIGWQIDNELNCHRDASYSQTDNVAFGNWLKNKYITIEELNKAWGTRFWSLEYNDFSQIECPMPTTTWRNPSILTDYYLFLSDSVINYASVQTKIIRKYMPNAFITHNGYFSNLDYKKLTEKCLDILSFDSYPVFFDQNEIGGGRQAEYRLAQTRGCSEKFLILEQQSGPGGQLGYLHPTPLPGQIRLWTYQSIIHGAVGVLYFRYRTALYGAEQLWHGIYDHDGEENYRSREIREISKELNRIGHIFLDNRKQADVAILFDYQNVCCNKAESVFVDDSRQIFNMLSAKNVSTDIIYSVDDLDKYKVAIIPHIAIADDKMKNKIEVFAKNGGIAIISARSGTKDKNAHYRPMKSPGIFSDITGCVSDWFTALSNYSVQSVAFEDKIYPVELYYETLDVKEGASIGVYTEGFGKGKPAVTKNGNIYYIGFYCYNNTEIYYDIIKKHIIHKESNYKNLEEILFGKYKMYLNHGADSLPFNDFDLLTESYCKEIPPYGVMLVENS